VERKKRKRKSEANLLGCTKDGCTKDGSLWYILNVFNVKNMSKHFINLRSRQPGSPEYKQKSVLFYPLGTYRDLYIKSKTLFFVNPYTSKQIIEDSIGMIPLRLRRRIVLNS
jgi:hypothetical protein